VTYEKTRKESQKKSVHRQEGRYVDRGEGGIGQGKKEAESEAISGGVDGCPEKNERLELERELKKGCVGKKGNS